MVVVKDGYDQAISREVTVPPEVTDLHVGMTKPGGGGGGATGGGGGTTAGGGFSGGQAQPGCAALAGKARAACLLNQKVAAKCGGVKPAKKKQVCAKRVRALSKCQTMKKKTKAQKRKKATCVRKAKATGKKNKAAGKKKGKS